MTQNIENTTYDICKSVFIYVIRVNRQSSDNYNYNIFLQKFLAVLIFITIPMQFLSLLIQKYGNGGILSEYFYVTMFHYNSS